LSFVKQCWRGEERVWRVFWVYGLGLFVVIIIGAGLLQSIIFRPWLLLLLVHAVWLSVSLWRCAFNSQHKVTGYLIRAWVIVFPIAALLAILLGFPDYQGF